MEDLKEGAIRFAVGGKGGDIRIVCHYSKRRVELSFLPAVSDRASSSKRMTENPNFPDCKQFRRPQCKTTLKNQSIDDVTYVYIQTAVCSKNTVYVMFRRAKKTRSHGKIVYTF